MKNKKRIVALSLASAMALSAVGVYGSTTVNAAESGEESKVTLTAWASVYANPGCTADLANNVATQQLEEVTGVHIDWNVIYGADSSDAETKFNLLLTGGEYPDLILANNFDRNTLYEAGKDGIVIPLNDLIEEYAPNMKAYFEENPSDYESLIAPDGNIYGLGYFSKYYHGTASNRLWVYQPWLDTLGLDMPQTTEEFYEMLIAFRDQDPNGNGQADEIGLLGLNDQALRFLMSAFCYYDGSYLEVEDGTVQFIANTEAYREGLRYLAKLYKEGLMPQDVYSMDTTQQAALCQNADACIVGTLGAFSFGSFFAVADENTYCRDYTAVTPLEGPDGVRLTVENPMLPTVNRFAITSACEDPVAAIQWVDYFFTDENSLTVNYGAELSSSPLIEGNEDYGQMGWWRADEGELNCLGEPAGYGYSQAVVNEEDANDNYAWGLQVAPFVQTIEAHTNYVVSQTGSSWANGVYYHAAEAYEPYKQMKSYSNLVLFNTDEGTEAIAEYKAQIDSLVSQWQSEFVVGVKDLDADWDTYLAELEALDLEGYVACLQNEYDYCNN